MTIAQNKEQKRIIMLPLPQHLRLSDVLSHKTKMDSKKQNVALRNLLTPTRWEMDW